MAAAAGAEVNSAPDPVDSSPALSDLIRRLRLYRPSLPSFGDEEVEEVGLNEGGRLFEVGPAEIPAAGPTFPRSERFQPKRAAVLICLFEGRRGDLRVILTKRSSILSTHSGEVSLPGGKVDDGDADDTATALREAKEEIGLDPSLVTVAAVLEPYLSKHLLRVVPVIGILSDKQAFKPVANVAEVETIFDAPLEMFLEDENHRSEEREWMGQKYLLHHFDYNTEGKNFVIWGLTAFVLIHAASIVYQRPPSFHEQRPKFRVPRYIKGKCAMP